MCTVFAILPRDVLEYELRPRLNNISLLCLRIALGLQDLPEQLTVEQQEQVVDNGLSLTKYFDNEDLLDGTCLATMAMKFGSIDILEYVVDCEYPLRIADVNMAAQYGHVHCLRWWHNKSSTEPIDVWWSHNICSVAVQHGQLACLKFLYEHGAPLQRSAVITAMMHGQLACLRYMHESGVLFDDILNRAGASLPCLQYVIEQGLEVSEETLIIAAECNNVDCMKLLHDMGITTTAELCEVVHTVEAMIYVMSIGHFLTEGCMSSAARVDDIDMVRFLIANNCPMDSDALERAIGNDNIDIARVLIANNCPMDSDVLERAIGNGNIEMVQMLHDAHCPSSTDMCYIAAFQDNLEILKFLHEHNYPWDTSVCHIAAVNDNLEILQYAFEQGLAWTQVTMKRAHEHKSTKCLQYLIEHGCPCPKNLEIELGIRPIYDSDD